MDEEIFKTHTDFVVYCIEEYKAAKKMSGKEVMELFKKHNVIDYIRNNYEALHTMGGLAITEDLQMFIDAGAN
ncbi:MAG: DUF3791 domain-containing protein [Elusimicrobiota bacterium]|jgi:hypothetical protein|nr:DUF3791 domain-containing protein [Elusimicrobiota bacterium]